MRRVLMLVVALLGGLAAPAVAAPTGIPATVPAIGIIGGDNNFDPVHGPCVVGFNARNARGDRLILTVGCGTPPGGGAVAAPVGSVSTALVRHGSGTLTVGGPAAASVGLAVCLHAPVGGLRCGSITALGQTIDHGGTVISGLIRTNICVHAGEGGAPLYRVSAGKAHAIGVLVGGSGSCGSGGVSWFKPVPALLSAHGLALLTG